MPLRSRFNIADAALHSKVVEVDSPKSTGAELLTAAGLTPPDEHVLLAILPNGDFEDLRLAEHPPDGVTDLVAFRSDRLYRFMLDTRQLAWGHPVIAGAVLEKLLGPGGAGKDIVLRRDDGSETIIDRTGELRLDGQGTEHLVSRPRSSVIFINAKRKTTTKASLTFEELIALAFDNPPTGPDVQFTVQYTRGPAPTPSGTLLEGQSVTIKNGMEFDVTSTNRS